MLVVYYKDYLGCNMNNSYQFGKQILDEAHLSKFSIHPGITKMYQDLKQNFWWTRMKRHHYEFYRWFTQHFSEA